MSKSKSKNDNWILSNRIGFNNKIYKIFHPDKYYIDKTQDKSCECDDKCDIKHKTFSLLPQQKLVKDYMQFNSPYRGILLYHELGSGKSAASIAILDDYIDKKDIFIFTPASLATNYENEILKASKLRFTFKKDWSLVKIDKKNNKLLNEKYYINGKDIIKKDNLVWIPDYKNDIDGAELLKTIKINSNEYNDNSLLINQMIKHIIRNKYKFISYNGLTNKIIEDLDKKTFDNSFIIIDEIHNFISSVVNGSKLTRSIYNNIMTSKDCKIVLLSGTPVINHPFELAILLNLVRGPLEVYKLNFTKDSAIPQVNEIKQKIENNDLYKYVDDYNINLDDKYIHISLLPNNFEKSDDTYLSIIKKERKINNKNLISKIINNINTIKNVKININYNTEFYYALPENEKTFNDIFINDYDKEDPKITNKDLFMRRILGTLSYYTITGSELFPDVLPTSIEYLDMTDHQLINYSEVRKIERDIDKKNKKKGGLLTQKTSVYRAFSRMVCNFAFPENIKRLYPFDIKRNLKKEIDIIDKDNSDASDKSDDKKEDKGKDEYKIKLNKAINDLLKTEALEIDNLEKYYSPKFARMLKNIHESPGTVLVYSQFRTVEGIGLFSEAMNKNGYINVDIKKEDGNYVFKSDDIFDNKYNNKRYIIFDQDKDKTNILMNIFNNEYDKLPESLKSKIPKNLNQLYGEFIRVFCITASGAEGISLKNVRRVLLMEPYWNNVRITQVIGRAIRTCSHINLPKKDQNVQVFKYILKFTKKQMEKDFTLRTMDKSKTTDEHILEIANKKENIINQFLDMLKASSFDCIINSKKNKPLENNYKCYNWAIGVNDNKLAYTNDIKDDYKIMDHKKYQIKKNNKGVVITRNGKKYVTIDKKIYDYFSYKNAGILVPVDIKDIS